MSANLKLAEFAAHADQSATAAWVRQGREIVRAEADALLQTSNLIGDSFAQAVDWIRNCRASVLVTGMGKAGLIGQKIAASLSSTGTRAHFLHPAEAVHGDLGCIHPEDLVIALSNSGETEEILRVLPTIRALGCRTIGITASETSTLGRGVDLPLPIGRHPEACPLGLAPSSTTTVMLAIGDALALVASQSRGFTAENFACFHPAGNLGKKLTPIRQLMRPLAECRVAAERLSVREVLIVTSRPGRRTGAIMMTDDDGKLTGLFTDSDLARLLEQEGDCQLSEPIASVMITSFQVIEESQPLPQAVALLTDLKISELPVVDQAGKPLGIIDITDVMNFMTDDSGTTGPPATSQQENHDTTSPHVLAFPGKSVEK